MQITDPGQAIEETKPFQNLVAARFGSGGGKDLHPFTYLRSMFALGLGRATPVSQQEFSTWCGVSRKLLTLVETRNTELSRRLADRVRSLTGASYDWLLGATGSEVLKFSYLDLARWFPVTMPQTAAELVKLYRLPRDPLAATTSHIIGALGSRSRLMIGTGELPAAVTERFGKDFTDGHWENRCGPTWQAFAFPASCEALKSAIQWNLLNEIPGWDHGAAPGQTQKDLAELAHHLTVELGKAERAGEIQRGK